MRWLSIYIYKMRKLSKKNSKNEVNENTKKSKKMRVYKNMKSKLCGHLYSNQYNEGKQKYFPLEYDRWYMPENSPHQMFREFFFPGTGVGTSATHT